jgi:hypothetical protein
MGQHLLRLCRQIVWLCHARIVRARRDCPADLAKLSLIGTNGVPEEAEAAARKAGNSPSKAA